MNIKDLVKNILDMGLDPKHPMVSLVLEQLEQEVKKLTQVQLNHLLNLLAEAYKDGYNLATELPDINANDPRGSIDDVVYEEWSGLSLEDIFSKSEQELFLGLKKELIIGLMIGTATGVVLMNMNKRVQKNTNHYKLIVETESVRVFNAGLTQAYEDSGVKQVMWLATPSERTCKVCSGLDRKVFSIKEKHQLPAHPMCRCVYVPVVNSDMEPPKRWVERGFNYTQWKGTQN